MRKSEAGVEEVVLLLDALNLMANVHNRGQIAEVKGRLEAMEERLARLESR